MKLAFYKAEHGEFYDKCVAWWTRPKKWKIWDYKSYSHVEILFSDNRTCFSSSAMDGGTRWTKIEDIYTSGHWDIVEVISKYDEETIIKFCNEQNNKKYDWLAIFFTMILPFRSEDPAKWFCSEVCGKAVFDLKSPYKYNPNKLYKFIHNKHTRQKS